MVSTGWQRGAAACDLGERFTVDVRSGRMTHAIDFDLGEQVNLTRGSGDRAVKSVTFPDIGLSFHTCVFQTSEFERSAAV